MGPLFVTLGLPFSFRDHKDRRFACRIWLGAENLTDRTPEGAVRRRSLHYSAVTAQPERKKVVCRMLNLQTPRNSLHLEELVSKTFWWFLMSVSSRRITLCEPAWKMEYNLAVAHNSDFRPLPSYFRQGACLTGRPREQRAVPGPNSLLFSSCCLMAHVKNKREFCRRALAARSCRVSQTWHRMVEMGFNIQMIQ